MPALSGCFHKSTFILKLPTFQTYYIEDGDKNKKTNFNYFAWRLSRTIFVFTDAAARGISLFYF